VTVGYILIGLPGTFKDDYCRFDLGKWLMISANSFFVGQALLYLLIILMTIDTERVKRLRFMVTCFNFYIFVPLEAINNLFGGFAFKNADTKLAIEANVNCVRWYYSLKFLAL
jgi:hypothetical protein